MNSNLDARIKQLEMQLKTFEGTATAVAAQLGVLSYLRLDELSGDVDHRGFEELLGRLAMELEECAEQSEKIRSASLEEQEAGQ